MGHAGPPSPPGVSEAAFAGILAYRDRRRRAWGTGASPHRVHHSNHDERTVHNGRRPQFSVRGGGRTRTAIHLCCHCSSDDASAAFPAVSGSIGPNWAPVDRYRRRATTN